MSLDDLVFVEDTKGQALRKIVVVGEKIKVGNDMP